MAKFCTGCGKELAEGLMFCTDCGTKVTESTQAEAFMQPEPVKTENTAPAEERQEIRQETQVQTIQQPQQTANAQYIPPQHGQNPQQYNPAFQAVQPTESHAASTAHFFWMMLVYSLPLIGWLICIIMAFAPKNESKKHFARAILIWGIIGIVISIIGLIVLSLLSGGISGILSEIY